MKKLGAEKCGRVVRSRCESISWNVWKPIDTLPSDGKFYLLYGDGRYTVCNKPEGCAPGVWEKSGKGWYGFSIYGDNTHWTELPDAP